MRQLAAWESRLIENVTPIRALKVVAIGLIREAQTGSGRDIGQFEHRPDEETVIVPILDILIASKFDTHCSGNLHVSKVPV